MKILPCLILFILIATFSGCKKQDNAKSFTDATVVIDCTGVYLRMNQKDYRVCNEEKVSSFDNGTKVVASFTTIKECPNEKIPICYMLHMYEGWINVNAIR